MAIWLKPNMVVACANTQICTITAWECPWTEKRKTNECTLQLKVYIGISLNTPNLQLRIHCQRIQIHQLNRQVGWVSLHLLPLFLLPPCWWHLSWSCFDTAPSPCMEGGSSPASQEGLGQLRGAAQLTTSQLSSAPLQSLVHHCTHHCTDCAGGQWQCQHKWQEDQQHCHCHCGLWTCTGHCVK